MRDKKQNKEAEQKPAANYINRELSWLDFNYRVFEEALDTKNPIFERLKFLAISSSNLDEFFMVRVSGLWSQIEAGYEKPDFAGLLPAETLAEISKKAHKFVGEQYSCLKRSIVPQLEKCGYFFVNPKNATPEQQKFIKDFFQTTVFPTLTPMAIDQSRPFPLLLNKSLNIIVELESEYEQDEDDDDNPTKYALVQVPSVESRFLELPPSEEEKREFVLLEDIIKLHLQRLFQGYKVHSSFCFRITRNSDLEIQEDDSDDLLNEIERSVQKRKWGEPNRIEVESSISEHVLKYLCDALSFNEDEIYKINGSIDLTMFFQFFGKGDDIYKNEDLKPLPPIEFIEEPDVFAAIKQRDILVHHPYQSFDCVVNFVQAAAADPMVLAIKQTLYRVSGNSPIIQALINAARAGKQVTVLVELKARFDEENNIIWARKLEQAGCHVIYGLVGLKTHCKICLVVRREDEGIQRYIHLGTGNYNDSTAKIYTDLSLFTRRFSFGSDISALFNTLTGYSEAPEWNKISVAPKSLRTTFETWIENEIEYAKNGAEARIIIKVNSIVDTKMIDLLYNASEQGVKIDLICRGICCLKPGIKGLSENITVTSIVDRFLEHSRIYYFRNGGFEKIFLSSADLMPRNLDRRVEVAFPVEQEDIKEIVTNLLDITLSDNVKARKLMPDGSYKRLPKGKKASAQSQLIFYENELKRYNSYIEEGIDNSVMLLWQEDGRR